MPFAVGGIKISRAPSLKSPMGGPAVRAGRDRQSRAASAVPTKLPLTPWRRLARLVTAAARAVYGGRGRRSVGDDGIVVGPTLVTLGDLTLLRLKEATPPQICQRLGGRRMLGRDIRVTK